MLLKSFLWGMPEQATVLLLLKALVCYAKMAVLFQVEGQREQSLVCTTKQ